MKDGELIETAAEADRIIDRAVEHLKAALQVMDCEPANHTPHDEEPGRRACEEHLTQAERLCIRLMTKMPKMSAKLRATYMSIREGIVKMRAEVAACGWKGLEEGSLTTAVLNAITKGS